MPSAILIHPGVWPQQTWAENWEGALPPFWEGRAGSPSNPMSSGPRPTSVPSGIFVHPAVWSQRTRAENWGLCLLGEGVGCPCNAVWPGPRPTSMPSFILIPNRFARIHQRHRQDRQRSDTIGRTVLRPEPDLAFWRLCANWNLATPSPTTVNLDQAAGN